MSELDTLAQIATPAFVVDREIFTANCVRMRDKAVRSRTAFRPHVKTHKTVEGARLQWGGSTGPITVSTLAEAEHFAAAGFDDITWAVPIDPAKLPRAAALAARIRRLNLVIDHADALQAIEQFSKAHETIFDLFVKVDCGYHRAGIDPESSDGIAFVRRVRASPAVRLHGLLTHAGHSYGATNVEEIRRIAAEEGACLTRLIEATGDGGSLIRSIGSTPTASVVERFEQADEVRPGNYVFFDAFQASIGSCRVADCSATVLASVIGVYSERGRVVLNAGALALSKDRGADRLFESSGYGVTFDLRMTRLPLTITALSQEHAIAEGGRAAVEQLRVGDKVRIVPNHSCLTAACYESYVVIEQGIVVDEWRPARGW